MSDQLPEPPGQRPPERVDGNAREPARAVVLQPRPSALIEFQADAIEVEERPPSWLARMTLYAVGSLIIAAITWAALAEVDQIVTAQGKLVTRAPNLVVQPLEVSVVRSVAVQQGAIVAAGDRLATLDPTISAADVEQLRAREQALDARVERLEAEIGEQDYRLPQPSAAQALELAIFQQRKALREAQVERLDREIAHLESEIATNLRDQRALGEQLEIVTEIEEMRAHLAASQVSSRLSLLEARHLRIEVDGQIDHLRGTELALAHRVQAQRAEKEAFLRDFNRSVLEELAAARDERSRIGEELVKASYRAERVELTAPVDSIVLEVAERSVGSVVREAEPMFTLVPLNEPLHAEVQVDAADIAHVAPGQNVRVKFVALPFQKHGTATGTIRTISADSFVTGAEQRASFYRVVVDLEDMPLRNVPAGFSTLPGMVLQVEILVGRRTVLSYLVYPLLRGLDESAREI